MNNFEDKNSLRKIIGALFIAGLLGFFAQSIFAQTGTISNTYDTTAPIIREIKADDITEYSARVRWQTDEPSTSFSAYGMTSSGLASYSQSRCDDGGYVLNHCIHLTNLYPGTKYYYRVESRNIAGINAYSFGYFITNTKSGGDLIATSTTTNTSTTSGSTSTASTATTDTHTTVESSVTTAATATAGATTDAQTTASSQTSTAVATSTATNIQTTAVATSTATAATVGTEIEVTTTAIATTTSSTNIPSVIPTIPPIPYSTVPVVKPAPIRSASPLVVPTKAPTPIVPSVSQTTERLESKIILKGGGNVFNGEEVYVKINQTVKSVEVRLSREDNPTSLYLGQAKFDPENARWVFHWDSTQTPDGKYTILSTITTSNSEVVQGDKRTVIVKNEKRVQAPDIATSSKVRTTSIVATSGEEAPHIAPFAVVDTEKFIEQIKKENQRIEEQAKKDISNILLTTEGKKTDPQITLFEVATTKKLLELKTALDEGNHQKKKEIVADIVNTATALSKNIPQDVLTKRVEESVAKLEQVVVAQKSGMVDTKNFEVTTVQTAEVVTKPDGTNTASKISFKGKALPNSFATLYIFSIPVVVTIKTDNDGYWNYTLDKELEDGNHQVFVAITDIKGSVVAKSEPVPFIKEASAITIDRIAMAPVQQEAPSFVGDNYFYGSVMAIIFIIVVILMLLGVNRRNTLR